MFESFQKLPCSKDEIASIDEVGKAQNEIYRDHASKINQPCFILLHLMSVLFCLVLVRSYIHIALNTYKHYMP